MKHFVLNDQKLINSYNFYLLNSGARMERFSANAPMLDNHSSDRLIGRWSGSRIGGRGQDGPRAIDLDAKPVAQDGSRSSWRHPWLSAKSVILTNQGQVHRSDLLG